MWAPYFVTPPFYSCLIFTHSSLQYAGLRWTLWCSSQAPELSKNISLRFLSLVLDLRNVLDYCPVFDASLFSASVFWLTVSHLHPESAETYFNPFFHLLFHCVTGCHTNQKHNRSTPALNSWQGGFFSIFFFLMNFILFL